MLVELSDRDIERIARRTAQIVLAKLKEREPEPELVSAKEAARILGISRDRLLRIKDKYPHVKLGDEKQSRVMFLKSGLI